MYATKEELGIVQSDTDLIPVRLPSAIRDVVFVRDLLYGRPEW